MELDPMPLAGAYYATSAQAVAAPRLPLTWVWCRRCQLVQVLEDVPDAVLFSNYNYASSTVPGLVRHFETYAELLQARYSSRARVHFLEIGCNDGVLLRKLPESWRLTGVDPSDVASAALSPPVSYDLLNEPFSLDLVKAHRLEGSCDVISGSNCLAHVSNLREIFQAAYLALRPGGHFWLEVHDLKCLLAGCQWDTIYHEHKVEWTEEALGNCLHPLGFSHQETFRIPMHGGALRICFKKGRGPHSPLGSESKLAEQFAALRASYTRRHDTPVTRTLKAAQRQGIRIAAYGAAGRANVYLNQMQEIRCAYVVDDSPLRVHKYIPGVGTPIVPAFKLKDSPAAYCLITAWNYRDDIIRKNPQHQGEWLTAFAAP
jgi:SAM-dependent methyltransferase